MKKILSLLTIFVAAILLVACGDGYTEVNLTETEILELLTNIDVASSDLSLKQQLDFVLKGNMETESVEVHYDFYTDSFIERKVSTVVDVDVDFSTYFGFGESLEELLAFLDLKKFEVTAEIDGVSNSVRANQNKLFHGGDGRIYADINVGMIEDSSALSFNGKYKSEQLITEEDYAYLLEMLQSDEIMGEVIPSIPDFDQLPIDMEIDFEQLFQFLDFKVSKKGDSYKLTSKIVRDDIIDMVLGAFLGFVGEQTIPEEFQEEVNEFIKMFKSIIKEFKVSFEMIITNNLVESITFDAKVDVDTTRVAEFEEMGLPLLKIKIDTFKISVKNNSAGVNIPTDLNTYTKDIEELFELFG